MKKENRTTPEKATAEPQNSAVPESSLLMQAIIECAIENGIRGYQALADKAGMTRPQVSNYARRKSQPSLENFMRLAKAAGAKVSVTNAKNQSWKK